MIVDIKTGDVFCGNTKIHLTKNEILTLNALNKKRLVTLEEIYREVYKVSVKELKEYEKRQLYTMVSRVRIKLKSYLKIISVSGFGYRIEVLNG